MFFFKYLFTIAACIVAMPCSAVFYQYASMINPQTGHQVHLFSDWHMGSLDKTLKQTDDASIFVKNIKGSKEVITEDAASKAAVIRKGIENVFVSTKHSPLKYSELGYALQNIPVHNVEFRILEKDAWIQVSCEAMQYNDPHPIIKDYYARVKRNFDQVSYDPFSETAKLHPVCAMLDMRIVHRIRHNEQQGINTSIVMVGGTHVDQVKDVLGKIGYQTKIMQGKTSSEIMDILDSEIMETIRTLIQEGIQKEPTADTVIDIFTKVGDKNSLDITSATQQT